MLGNGNLRGVPRNQPKRWAAKHPEWCKARQTATARRMVAVAQQLADYAKGA